MSDLIDRLRAYEGSDRETAACYNGSRDEAADEIERLRAENARLRRERDEAWEERAKSESASDYWEAEHNATLTTLPSEPEAPDAVRDLLWRAAHYLSRAADACADGDLSDPRIDQLSSYGLELEAALRDIPRPAAQGSDEVREAAARDLAEAKESYARWQNGIEDGGSSGTARCLHLYRCIETYLQLTESATPRPAGQGDDQNAGWNWVKGTVTTTDDDNGPREGHVRRLHAWRANGFTIIQQDSPDGLFLLRGALMGSAWPTLAAAKAEAGDPNPAGQGED